jgi:hypothetical protein
MLPNKFIFSLQFGEYIWASVIIVPCWEISDYNTYVENQKEKKEEKKEANFCVYFVDGCSSNSIVMCELRFSRSMSFNDGLLGVFRMLYPAT